MDDSFPARPRRAPTFPAAGFAVAVALAAAVAPGCSSYIGTTAASFLRKVRDDPDPNIRYLAYAKLARPSCYDSDAQKAEAVKTLIAKLEEGREPVASRAVILRTLGELGDPGAREAVLKAVNDPEPVLRVQACRALGKVGRTEDATVLARVMATDTLEDCRIAAIEALGVLKPDDPRVTRVLVVALRHDDPATRLASLNALRRITGKDLGVDVVAWEKALPAEAPAEPAAAPAEGLMASPAPAAPADPPALTSAPAPAPAPAAAPDSSPTPAVVPAPAQTATASSSPSYPPRPAPIADPVLDGETHPVALPGDAGAGTHGIFPRDLVPAPAPNPAAAPEPYPAHNPNLPAAAAPSSPQP